MDIEFNTGDIILCSNSKICLFKNYYVHTGIIYINPLNKTDTHDIFVLEFINKKCQINKLKDVLKDYNQVSYLKLNINRNINFFKNCNDFLENDTKLILNKWFRNNNKYLINKFFIKINIIKNNFDLNLLIKNKIFDKPIIIDEKSFKRNFPIILYEDL